MKYLIYKTHARFVFRYLPFSSFSALLPFLAFLTAFSLAAIIDIKVAKTNTSFLFFFLGIFTRVIAFLFAEKVFNMVEIFFFFFNNDINTYYKEILASTLFLPTIVLKTSLVVLVFFINLIDKKLLFSIRYINKGNVSRLYFLKVFILLFC